MVRDRNEGKQIQMKLDDIIVIISNQVSDKIYSIKPPNQTFTKSWNHGVIQHVKQMLTGNDMFYTTGFCLACQPLPFLSIFVFRDGTFFYTPMHLWGF